MIEIEDLHYRYDPATPPVLNGVSLRLQQGQYVALIGPNGCGKTTLARHLNGLVLPGSGRVSIDGMETLNKRNLPEIRRRVGMVFQNPENQIVGATVEEDVAFGPGNLGLPPTTIRELVVRSLQMVGLTGYETRHPHSLSGGEKQLLAVAGILAMTPRYVILDEPTASLDPHSRQKVLSLIMTLTANGIGVVHITHAMEEVASADRVIVMEKGRIAADGSPSDVFRRIAWLRSLGLAPPKITELMCRLGETLGEEDGGAVFTVEQAMERIASLISGPTRSSFPPNQRG